MKTELSVMGGAARTAVPAAPSTDGNSRPVLVWGTIGAGFLAFNAYLYARWVLSGDAQPVDKSPDPVPASVKFVVHGWEALISVFFVILLYRWVIRPWRQNGHVTMDGLFLLGFLSLTWQDVFMNYTQTAFLYNTEFVNFGSWYRGVPGWISPNGHQVPEPLLGIFTLYGPFFFLGAVVGCWLMRKAKEHRPTLRAVSLFALTTAFFIGWLIVFEFVCMRFGQMWSYPGAARSGALGWLTLFKGTYYQYPVYVEGLFGGILMATFATVRYYRNDRGETWAERGSSDLRIGRKGSSLLRFAAICGILNVVYLGTYFIPWNVFSLNSDDWPRSIIDRPHLVGGNRCGPTTTYACPGPGVPIPRPDSAHLDPDGGVSTVTGQ